MTSYDIWINAVVQTWHISTNKCHDPHDTGKERLKVAKMVNFRNSKSAIHQAVSDLILVTRKASVEYFAEALMKGDIIPAYGHYRLSPDRVEQFLNWYRDNIDSSISVDYLKRRTNKRRTNVPQQVYVPIRHKVETPTTEPQDSPQQVNQMDKIKHMSVIFIQIVDCMRSNNISFDQIEEFDVDNDITSFQITYRDGTTKSIPLGDFAKQWEEYINNFQNVEDEELLIKDSTEDKEITNLCD